MNQFIISNLSALRILQLLFPSRFLLFQCLRASNAYLQFLLGPTTKMLFEFVNEMPKPETQIKIDLASVLGPLFFTWVILQLLPIRNATGLVVLAIAVDLGALKHTLCTLVPVIGASRFVTAAAATAIGTVVDSFR